MKLSYRGNEYTTETALLEVREADITGKYRGQKWSYKLPRHIPQLQPKFELKYRGIAYSTCARNIKPYFADEQSEIITDKLTIPQVTEQNLAKIHIENLRKNLERRIKIAQQSGNLSLLELLSKESEELLQLS